jgi:hypothetical protein
MNMLALLLSQIIPDNIPNVIRRENEIKSRLIRKEK